MQFALFTFAFFSPKYSIDHAALELRKRAYFCQDETRLKVDLLSNYVIRDDTELIALIPLPRLFGMTGVIRTKSSNPNTLSLHPHVSWPDFINPLVLLLLYYTLVALLHKWVHITEEVCVYV